MFTILKERENLESYDDDYGWYPHPETTLARFASHAELHDDGLALQ